MAGKMNPERREELRRLNEEGLRDRERLQQTIERIEARLRAEEERREYRRRLVRRIFSFGRAT
jgi:hypothetical protein